MYLSTIPCFFFSTPSLPPSLPHPLLSDLPLLFFPLPLPSSSLLILICPSHSPPSPPPCRSYSSLPPSLSLSPSPRAHCMASSCLVRRLERLTTQQATKHVMAMAAVTTTNKARNTHHQMSEAGLQQREGDGGDSGQATQLAPSLQLQSNPCCIT